MQCIQKKTLYFILKSLVLSYFCIQNGGGEVEAVAAANPGPAQPDDPVPDVQVPDLRLVPGLILWQVKSLPSRIKPACLKKSNCIYKTSVPI